MRSKPLANPDAALQPNAIEPSPSPLPSDGRGEGRGEVRVSAIARFGKNLWLLVPLALLALIFLADPRGHSFFPPCIFHQVTGWNCPGCGATRATHDLLHGQFVRAFRDNALFVAALPLLAWFGARKIFRRSSPTSFSPRWLWLLAPLILVFSIWRNLPAGAWWNP
jgi:hypothetical protein